MRLTNAIREEIARTLLTRGFSQRETDLEERSIALGKEIYDELLPQHIQQHMKALCEFDKNAFEYSITIDVSGPGQFHQSVRMVPLKATGLPIPYSWRYSCAVKYQGDEDIFKRLEALATEKRKLRQEKRDTESQINGILNSITTTGALRRQWGELGPIIDELEGSRKPNQISYLPAVMLDSLNKLFKLPPEAEDVSA